MSQTLGDLLDQLFGDLNVCPLLKDVGETICTFFRGGFGNFVENIIEPTVNLALTALGAFYTAHCLNWLLYAPMTVEEVTGTEAESTADAAATTSKAAVDSEQPTSSRNIKKYTLESPSSSRKFKRRKISAKTKALIAALIEEHFNDEDHSDFDKIDTDNEDDHWDNWCYSNDDFTVVKKPSLSVDKKESFTVVKAQSLPKQDEIPQKKPTLIVVKGQSLPKQDEIPESDA